MAVWRMKRAVSELYSGYVEESSSISNEHSDVSHITILKRCLTARLRTRCALLRMDVTRAERSSGRCGRCSYDVSGGRGRVRRLGDGRYSRDHSAQPTTVFSVYTTLVDDELM